MAASSTSFAGAQRVEQVLAGVRERLEPVEAQEAAGALDGVDRAVDLRQQLGIARVVPRGRPGRGRAGRGSRRLSSRNASTISSSSSRPSGSRPPQASRYRRATAGGAVAVRRRSSPAAPRASVDGSRRCGIADARPRRSAGTGRRGASSSTGELRELLGRAVRLGGALRRAAGGLGDAGDVAGDLVGARGRLADVAADLAGRGRLLLDRRGDRGLDVVDLGDDRADLADRRDRVLRVALDRLDLAADVLGGLAVLRASSLTSLATTAKPLPASPARAASIVAFSASRLVCSAIEVMTLMTLPISAELAPSLATVVVGRLGDRDRLVATRAASVAFLAISRMLAPISSAPAATAARCAHLLGGGGDATSPGRRSPPRAAPSAGSRPRAPPRMPRA